MKTVTPAYGGFLTRIVAPRIEVEGVFLTRKAAAAAANIGRDQIARNVAPMSV